MNLPRLFVKATTPIVSMFLILMGIIQLRAQVWTIGAICILLGMAGFVFGIRLLENTPFTAEEFEFLRPYLTPAILWAIVISVLTLSIFYVSDNLKSPETDRIAAGAWVSSVILGIFTIGWKRSRRNDRQTLLERIRANRTELIILLIVLILALALRTIDLSTHPYPWSGDEASIGSEAMHILSGETTNFFDTGWSSQPNWSFVPTAISELIFGKNILAVRLPSALAGMLAVLFVYLAARELFNPTIALMAAAFLATLPYNLHFSRVGVANIVDSLMSSLIFWLIARAIKKDDLRYYYSAGAMGGLCIYTYAGTRLALLLAGIAILFLIIRQKSYLSSHRKHLLAFSTAIVISAAPQAAFFVRHPDIFFGRFAQEGILFNGWLTQQEAQTGKSVWEILFQQFTKTTMVFIASPAIGNFFNSPSPYLTILGSILFLLGMAYAFAYGFETRYFILLIWFWAVILFGGILTMNPPANTRMLMTSPAVALLMALGAHKMFEYLQKFKIVPEKIVAPVFVLIVGMITYQNVNFYMVEYRNKMYFQDANGEYAMEIGLMANKLGKGFQIFLLGAPRIFSSFPTFSYVAPNNPRTDLNVENIDSFELPSNKRVGFFATPENHLLLQEISQKYPGGESGVFYRKSKPKELLFEYYILKP
jgi:4-amino-4-deoxy-L-arabinose transferase and related glycosyltransferases of PMT family